MFTLINFLYLYTKFTKIANYKTYQYYTIYADEFLDKKINKNNNLWSHFLSYASHIRPNFGHSPYMSRNTIRNFHDWSHHALKSSFGYLWDRLREERQRPLLSITPLINIQQFQHSACVARTSILHVCYINACVNLSYLLI